MRKGVANFWWYRQVALQANSRYLDALAAVQPGEGEVLRELEDLCRSNTKEGRRIAKFNPVSEHDNKLFEGVMAGEHCLTGFRNADLQRYLFDTEPTSPRERTRRSRCVTRLLRKLRGHDLVRKLRRSRIYRVTARGYRLLAAAVRYRKDSPRSFNSFHRRMFANGAQDFG